MMMSAGATLSSHPTRKQRQHLIPRSFFVDSETLSISINILSSHDQQSHQERYDCAVFVILSEKWEITLFVKSSFWSFGFICIHNSSPGFFTLLVSSFCL